MDFIRDMADFHLELVAEGELATSWLALEEVSAISSCTPGVVCGSGGPSIMALNFCTWFSKRVCQKATDFFSVSSLFFKDETCLSTELSWALGVFCSPGKTPALIKSCRLSFGTIAISNFFFFCTSCFKVFT